MSEVVIDRNVLAVANRLADHADCDCVAACIERLLRAQREHRVVVDEGGLIIDEYRHHCTPGNPQRTGDQFLLWLWRVQATPDRCRRVPLTPTGDDRRPFAEFPDDARLADFHTDDHKYVAAAGWLSRHTASSSSSSALSTCPAADLVTAA